MQPRFNIAACPIDQDDNESLFRLSSNYLLASNGYCLLRGAALPHVTLCQFRAQDNESAVALVRDSIGIEFDVSISEIYVKHHVKSDGYWVGFNVLRGAQLIEEQSRIVRSLEGQSIETLTGSRDEYFPHFTVARILLGKVPIDLLLSDKTLLGRTIPCRLKLGVSDENGQFVSILAE